MHKTFTNLRIIMKLILDTAYVEYYIGLMNEM